MCNPRRIRVNASRQIDEAWQREVSRRIELSDRVVGEARVRQNLRNTVGGPALSALEGILAAEGSGWEPVERGFRRDVEGGYVLYDTDEQVLEIVATASSEIRALGEASETLEGRVQTTVDATGEGMHYDDNYGGRTAVDAQRDAETNLERNMQGATEAARRQSMDQAERDASSRIEDAAHRDAAQHLERERERSREELTAAARSQLQSVGLRARQVFNRVLASAYRDAIQAYASRHGAQGWNCTESDEVVEIEFRVSR